MKRSFYEMLGVARNADKAQIDAAYELAMNRLNAEDVRGVAEAVNERQLIRDGYQILSNPTERASYDAKLAASDSGVRLTLYPEDSAGRRKLGIESLILAALAVVLGAVVYAKLTQRTDAMPVTINPAVAKQKGTPTPPATTASAPQADVEIAKAGEEEKR